MPAKINMSPAAPEDNQQDRIAKFEDLLPAAKLQQLNSVKLQGLIPSSVTLDEGLKVLEEALETSDKLILAR